MGKKKKEAKQKQITAAIAGVMAYIQTEEEAALLAAAQTAAPAAAPQAAAPAPAAPFKPWGMSGRQQMMEMRNLMQWKAFHGVRFR